MSHSAFDTLSTLEHLPVSFKDELLPILGHILDDLCHKNDDIPSNSISKFHSAHSCNISIKQYLARIYDYANCSDACFVMALIFIDRMQQYPGFSVCSLNIHRLLVTSLMVAAKSFDDCYFSNKVWAKIGGITKHELNVLEVEFLFMIGFSLFISDQEYSQYYSEVVAQARIIRQKHVRQHDDTLMDWSCHDVSSEDEKMPAVLTSYSPAPGSTATTVTHSPVSSEFSHQRQCLTADSTGNHLVVPSKTQAVHAM